MKRKVLLIGLIMLILAAAQVALAAPLDRYGASSRATAMGGAMIGIAEGGEAIYHNSSALALSPNSTQIGIANLEGHLMMNDTDMGPSGQGFSMAVTRRILWDRLGLGLYVGMYPGTGGFSNVGTLPIFGGGISTPGWAMYSGGTLPIDFSFGWGVRILDQLAVGGLGTVRPSMISMSPLPILVDPLLKALLGIAAEPLPMPADISTYSFGMGNEPNTSVHWQGNVTFRPVKYLSLGLSYNPQDWTTVKARLRLIGGASSIMEKDHIYLFEFKNPGPVENLTWGGALNIPLAGNTLTLAYQHEDQHWDGHYGYSKEWDWDVGSKFNSQSFNSPTRDPGLKDITLERYGMELLMPAESWMPGRLKCKNPKVALRGGYYHWDSPYPHYKYTWQMVGHDSDADVYSGGIGLDFDRNPRRQHPVKDVQRRMSIDMHVQYFDLEEWTTSAHPDEFGNVFYPLYIHTQGNILNMGLQVTWWY